MRPPSFLTTGKISFRPPWSNTEFNELSWGRVTSCHVQEIPPAKKQKSYFQNLNQNWPTLLEIENSVSCNPHKQGWFFSSHIVIRGQQPRNHLTLVQLSAMRCGRHCLHNFCHIRYSLPHTHTMFVRTVSLVMHLHPSPIPFDATTTKKSVAGLYEGLFCYLLYEIFVIRKTCSKKLPKTTWKWGGNSLMSPVSGRGLANKDICLPLRLGIRWLDGKLKKNWLII